MTTTATVNPIESMFTKAKVVAPPRYDRIHVVVPPELVDGLKSAVTETLTKGKMLVEAPDYDTAVKVGQYLRSVAEMITPPVSVYVNLMYRVKDTDDWALYPTTAEEIDKLPAGRKYALTYRAGKRRGKNKPKPDAGNVVDDETTAKPVDTKPADTKPNAKSEKPVAAPKFSGAGTGRPTPS